MNRKAIHLPCLFLDRDGVINRRIPNDYVKTWDEFVFLPQVLTILKSLKDYFDPIFIVTNQQGVGKGLMSETQLISIHRRMKRIIRKNGGKIDEVFYCPDLSVPASPCRKPNIGMGLKAKQLYPDIEWGNSVMVGDSVSDVLFGKNLGMSSILLNPDLSDPSGRADFVFRDFMEFYLNFVKKRKAGRPSNGLPLQKGPAQMK